MVRAQEHRQNTKHRQSDVFSHRSACSKTHLHCMSQALTNIERGGNPLGNITPWLNADIKRHQCRSTFLWFSISPKSSREFQAFPISSRGWWGWVCSAAQWGNLAGLQLSTAVNDLVLFQTHQAPLPWCTSLHSCTTTCHSEKPRLLQSTRRPFSQPGWMNYTVKHVNSTSAWCIRSKTIAGLF